MMTRIVYIALFVLLSITGVTSAATWWDAKDVHRTEDGCIEYSLQLSEYVNKNNGDVFSGVVVQKYGRFYPYHYDKYSQKVKQFKNLSMSVENGVMALKGTINGKDIASIPLCVDTEVKYVTHRNNKKCFYINLRGKTQEVKEHEGIKKRKGIDVFETCECPIISVVEKRPIVTEENKAVWEMMGAMNLDCDVDLVNDSVKVDESITTYLEPNMFNGTYIINGEVRTLDLHTVKNRTKKVSAYPLKSIYANSVIFQIYDSKSGINEYCVYKEGDTYKVTRGMAFPEYIQPTEDIINYAEVIARMIGIDMKR